MGPGWVGVAGGGKRVESGKVVTIEREEAIGAGAPVMEKAGMVWWKTNGGIIGDVDTMEGIADRACERDEERRDCSNGRITEAEAAE